MSISLSSPVDLTLDLSVGSVVARPLKSRRVPIQLSKKRASANSLAAGGNSPTNGEADIARCVQAAALAARDAVDQAETRRSRRSSRRTSTPISPIAMPLLRTGISEADKKEKFDLASSGSSSPLATTDDLSLRHSRELAALRARHAAEESQLIQRQQEELKSHQAKRRRITKEPNENQ